MVRCQWHDPPDWQRSASDMDTVLRMDFWDGRRLADFFSLSQGIPAEKRQGHDGSRQTASFQKCSSSPSARDRAAFSLYVAVHQGISCPVSCSKFIATSWCCNCMVMTLLCPHCLAGISPRRLIRGSGQHFPRTCGGRMIDSGLLFALYCHKQ